MISNLTDTTTLNNGVAMPWLGFGVFKMKDGAEVEQAVEKALEVGYRSIDTAQAYKNEVGVGKAIKASGVPREEIFVTTKVSNPAQREGKTLQAFEESRKKLGLDYIDLYLIHWPVKERYAESWQVLEKLYADGVVRAIGVSNFHIHHLQDIFAISDIVPAVNQIEIQPFLVQEELRAYCAEHQIQAEAWSPLARGEALVHPTILEISQKHQKTPAQVTIRWGLQHGVITIPKSSTPHRIAENVDVFDFELSEEDIARIDGLNANKRTGPDPDNFSH